MKMKIFIDRNYVAAGSSRYIVHLHKHCTPWGLNSLHLGHFQLRSWLHWVGYTLASTVAVAAYASVGRLPLLPVPKSALRLCPIWLLPSCSRSPITSPTQHLTVDLRRVASLTNPRNWGSTAASAALKEVHLDRMLRPDLVQTTPRK